MEKLLANSSAFKVKLLSQYLVLVIMLVDSRFLKYGDVFMSIFPSIEFYYLQCADTYSFIKDWNLTQWVWRFLFGFCALNIFRGKYVKPSMLAIGILIILAVSASNLLYNNNAFYSACLFIIIGLAPKKFVWRFIFIQVSIVYLMTVLSKGDGWYNGDFFATVFEKQFFFRRFLSADFLSTYIPNWSLIAISIITLIIEVLIGVLILFQKGRKYSAIIALFFHLLLAAIMGKTFNVFMAIILGVNWIILYPIGISELRINPNRYKTIYRLLKFIVGKKRADVIKETDQSGLTVKVNEGITYRGIRAFFAILRNSPRVFLFTPFLFLLLTAPYLIKVRPFIVVAIFSSLLILSTSFKAFKGLKTI